MFHSLPRILVGKVGIVVCYRDVSKNFVFKDISMNFKVKPTPQTAPKFIANLGQWGHSKAVSIIGSEIRVEGGRLFVSKAKN